MEILGLLRTCAGVRECFFKVNDPITELVVTRRDEAALVAVQGVAYGEGCPAIVSMVWQVRWIDAVAQEEGIPPFLRP